ncbi:MAG: hypothetical protein AAGG69_11525 [Pseudomonadota bacterium]
MAVTGEAEAILHHVGKIVGSLAISFAACVVPALAEDIPFNANVSSSCTLDLVSGGTFGVRADRMRLGSGLPGGTHGFANATTNSNGFSLGLTIPTAFSAEPPNDVGSPEDFSVRWWGTGDTSWTSTQIDNFTASDWEPLNAGTTNIRLRLAAQKPTGETFAGGTYSAFVTLTCSS